MATAQNFGNYYISSRIDAEPQDCYSNSTLSLPSDIQKNTTLNSYIQLNNSNPSTPTLGSYYEAANNIAGYMLPTTPHEPDQNEEKNHQPSKNTKKSDDKKESSIKSIIQSLGSEDLRETFFQFLTTENLADKFLQFTISKVWWPFY